MQSQLAHAFDETTISHTCPSSFVTPDDRLQSHGVAVVEERRPWGHRKAMPRVGLDTGQCPLGLVRSAMTHVSRDAGVNMFPFSVKEFGTLDWNEVQNPSANTVGNALVSFVHVVPRTSVRSICWLINTLWKASISVIMQTWFRSAPSLCHCCLDQRRQCPLRK